MIQTISKEYKEQCVLMHQSEPTWGNLTAKPMALKSNLEDLLALWDSNKQGTILDYGCGKGWLAANFVQPVHEYDPGIPGKDSPPEPADLVVCLDVLEHIEPEYLTAVLDDLQRVIKKRGFFTVACNPAIAILPDGRNAHLIVENSDWWLKKLLERFHIEFVNSANKKMVVIVKKLNDGSY